MSGTLPKSNVCFFRYDEDHDVLHVWFPPVGLAYDDEEADGVFVRRSEQDDHVVGLTILDYSKRDREILEIDLPWLDVDTLPSVGK